MNIVLIVADTFRRDHLGCYGNEWIRTPHLDRLAKRSTVFDCCYAASFPTVPHRSDLLTGRFNFAYLGWMPLPQEETTLPQLLKGAGYVTMGVVDTPFYLRNGYGYDRGFDDFIWVRGQGFRGSLAHTDVVRDRRCEAECFAPATLGTAEKWLEQHHKEQFFLLVDTWDPHEPWDPPNYYVELYEEESDVRPAVWPPYWYWKEAGLSEEDVRTAHAHYCGEITMVDRAVGRLLERLESLRLMDDTAIIFTSDHGFYFGEHGILGKGLFKREQDRSTGVAEWYRSPLYDEVTRVPLVVYLPRTEAKYVDGLVSSPDLMPTILELAQLPVPQTVQATSLLPPLRGEQAKFRDFVVTSWPLHGRGLKLRVVDDVERCTTEVLPTTITDGEWTLISSVWGEPVELYHTISDPKQQQNVLDGNEVAARELHGKLLSLLEELGTSEELLAPRRKLL